jgi:hypothetical protein
MSMSFFFSPRPKQLMQSCLALIWVLLVACGGGGTSLSGVGSGGSGVAEGSVSGFGSVIVDGVTYEDTNASVLLDNAQGSTDQTQAKLGQRVRITHSQAGVADQIIVLPQLRGAASSAADSNGWFQLLGQWVHIISTSDTQNTATVLDGLTTVTRGDALEVHGTWIFDSGKNVSVLVATRIEKLSTTPDPVLISGVVRARSGNTLTLDNASGTTLQYSNMPSSIGAQSLITAWVPLSATGASPWVATRLIDASPQVTGNQHLLLGTQISGRDITNGIVMVQGMSVKLPSNWASTPPALGAAVQMDIVRDGDSWKAVSVTERQSKNDLGGAVSLKGNVSWSATSSTLTLRDVTVSTSPLTLSDSCANVQAGDDVYLEITAQRGQAGQSLLATQVTCSLQTPSNAVIERSGKLTRVTPDAGGLTGTLVVTTKQGPQTFKWTALTLLPLALNQWLNKNVDVEYQVINSENRLRRIKLD